MNQIFWVFGYFLSLPTNCQISKNDDVYCDKQLCPPGVPHITCNPHNWELICEKLEKDEERKILQLNETDIEKILERHNHHRNQIAGGLVKGFHPASRMATMMWDAGLEQMALLNINQCELKYDGCHNTWAFMYSGQNIHSAEMEYSKKTLDDEIAQRAFYGVNKWYQKMDNANAQKIRRYCSKEFYDEFAIGVVDRNKFVGCALLTYERLHTRYILFTCNYASMPVVGRQVYQAGRTAEQCETGTDSDKYIHLCSKAEKYESYYPPYFDSYPYGSFKTTVIILLTIIVVAILLSVRLIPKR